MESFDSSASVATIDPALLRVLKNYAAQDQARLLAIINRLPENDRLLLQHAIDSYQAILDTEAATAN